MCSHPTVCRSIKRRKARCQIELNARRIRAEATVRRHTGLSSFAKSSWEPDECVPERQTLTADAAVVDAEARRKPPSARTDSLTAGVDDGATAFTSCDIPIVHASELSTQALIGDWIGRSAPVLVRGTRLPKQWREGWSRVGLQERLGDVALRHEMYPYAEGSAPIIAVAPNRCTRLCQRAAAQARNRRAQPAEPCRALS